MKKHPFCFEQLLKRQYMAAEIVLPERTRNENKQEKPYGK